MAIAIPALPRPRRARCLTSCEKPTLHIGRSEHVVKRLHIPSSYEGAGNNYFRSLKAAQGFRVIYSNTVDQAPAPYQLLSFCEIPTDNEGHESERSRSLRKKTPAEAGAKCVPSKGGKTAPEMFHEATCHA